ncbi:uncharacterized protein TM35_000531010, partial [Trypanosoma theileri]
SIKEFYERIRDESNGESFHQAWEVASKALDKWEEEEDNRTGWDEAKVSYDAELTKWKELQPECDKYVQWFDAEICRHIAYVGIRAFAVGYLLPDWTQILIRE